MERKAVIIDTDPGIDDALALLLAGASSELEVLAVTTVGGNVSVELATENARRVLPVAWGEQPLPPLYMGEQRAVEDAEEVHGSDGLGGGSQWYPVAAPLAEGRAVEQIARLARSRPSEVTLVTLGPLTNLAQVIREQPKAAALLREVVIMGGAFQQPGNITPVAEFNIYVDPEAAQVVCESGIPLRWVSTNITHQCLMRDEEVRARLEAAPANRCPRLRMAQEISGDYISHHALGFGDWACILHDPVAVGAALWPELFRAQLRRVDVETFGRFTRGMTVADFRPGDHRSRSQPNSYVCLEIDHEEFVRRFLDRLCAA